LLVLRIPASRVTKRLSVVGQTIAPNAVGVWLRQVAIYFAYQCLYYGAVYERQADLHQQAIWQMEAWAKILHDLTAVQSARVSVAGPNR